MESQKPKTKMKPRERRAWIAEYIKARGNIGIDCLNRDFVDDYTEATGARFHVMLFGANYCRQLAADLLAMLRLGQVKRGRVGLAGNWQPGFPTWVWSYKLTDKWNAEAILADEKRMEESTDVQPNIDNSPAA